MREPPLIPADEVGGPVQSEVLKRGRGKARAVALIAYDNDALVVIGDFAEPMRAGGIESPFQNVSIDDDRSRQFPVSTTLFDRPYVYDEGSGIQFGSQLLWSDASQTRPCVDQEGIDRSAS